MTDSLHETITALYAEYQPLKGNQHLVGGKADLSFQHLVQQKTQDFATSLQKRIHDELFGWGPLQPLLQREDIFDIIIQGPDHIYYESPQGLARHDDCFQTERSFQNFVERISREAGVLINHRDPFANGKVDSFRLHMVIPPITPYPVLTLRRHNQKVFKLQEMKQSGFINDKQYEYLQQMISEKSNFLVIGPTGSGKTTFLNALLGHMPQPQRLVVIEDTDEIQIHDPLACKLLSREICPETLSVITMEDLVKQALRMRPDRIVIGEVRGKEAKDLLQALATGHSGSMGTMHAQSAKQALLRLEMLVQMGAPQWSLHSIRQLIQMSVDHLVVLNEDRQNKGVQEICKITSHESFGLLLETIRN